MKRFLKYWATCTLLSVTLGFLSFTALGLIPSLIPQWLATALFVISGGVVFWALRRGLPSNFLVQLTGTFITTMAASIFGLLIGYDSGSVLPYGPSGTLSLFGLSPSATYGYLAIGFIVVTYLLWVSAAETDMSVTVTTLVGIAHYCIACLVGCIWVILLEGPPFGFYLHWSTTLSLLIPSVVIGLALRESYAALKA